MPSKRYFLSCIYVLLAILGAVLPMLANIDFINNYGPSFDLDNFIKLANINPAAQSLSRDLFIGAGATTIWMFSEARRLKIKHFWLVIISMFVIAFAFAAPLFLFLRELRMIELEKDGFIFEYN
ncbi:DUF2834 domain-containing protein [Prochlorococcus marinus]|uniref:DUF2834 domain-containing protein n=1 Tax=Prochlorococcus marinus (strain MIT 9211) TaxID=93059 RepID=A9BB66_PROM4|nr:DUF2834 domain-containing protein [Prochlorococcus marinus]ABX09078.1 Hypothetical protein P9211_11471 [Prochlorococcus marinus str. MIT 9211]